MPLVSFVVPQEIIDGIRRGHVLCGALHSEFGGRGNSLRDPVGYTKFCQEVGLIGNSGGGVDAILGALGFAAVIFLGYYVHDDLYLTTAEVKMQWHGEQMHTSGVHDAKHTTR